MTNFFARVRPFDIARIERFHWSAWITCVLANQVLRVRLVGFEELFIATLFLWLATVYGVAALRGAVRRLLLTAFMTKPVPSRYRFSPSPNFACRWNSS
jgi:hypothetical protein